MIKGTYDYQIVCCYFLKVVEDTCCTLPCTVECCFVTYVIPLFFQVTKPALFLDKP